MKIVATRAERKEGARILHLLKTHPLASRWLRNHGAELSLEEEAGGPGGMDEIHVDVSIHEEAAGVSAGAAAKRTAREEDLPLVKQARGYILGFLDGQADERTAR